MNKLEYNIINDTNTYVMTCTDELLNMYMELLFENGAYRVNLNNKLVFGALLKFKEWKDAK